MKLFGKKKTKKSESEVLADTRPPVVSVESYQLKDGMLIEEIENALIGQEQEGSLDQSDDFLIPHMGPIENVLINDSPGAKTESLYRSPASAKKVITEMGWNERNETEEGGLIWNATIVPDDFLQPDGSFKMLRPNDYDKEKKLIKPRRGGLVITSSDFFGSLTMIAPTDEDTDVEDDFELFRRPTRWVFSGILNGWPGLRHLEVLKIEHQGVVPRWKSHWESSKNSENKPTFPDGTGITKVRAKLRAGGFTAKGWSKESPGYVFWFQGNASRLKNNRVLYGTNIVKAFEEERIEKGTWKTPKAPSNCTMAHMISHRYATGDSTTMKDRVLYHSIVLLEWDHGEYCSVVELAWLNGLGGYHGRSNWLEDKTEPINSFYKVLPPEMTVPWRNSLSEIRVFDVKAKNLDEFLEFMGRYEGLDKRFYDINRSFSHATRLTFRSREHIAQYLINYITRARTYSEIQRNCQTFAADFCAFLAGKKDVQPFHRLNRVDYRNQTHYFLYESTMYGYKKT